MTLRDAVENMDPEELQALLAENVLRLIAPDPHPLLVFLPERRIIRFTLVVL